MPRILSTSSRGEQSIKKCQPWSHHYIQASSCGPAPLFCWELYCSTRVLCWDQSKFDSKKMIPPCECILVIDGNPIKSLKRNSNWNQLPPVEANFTFSFQQFFIYLQPGGPAPGPDTKGSAGRGNLCSLGTTGVSRGKAILPSFLYISTISFEIEKRILIPVVISLANFDCNLIRMAAGQSDESWQFWMPKMRSQWSWNIRWNMEIEIGDLLCQIILWILYWEFPF